MRGRARRTEITIPVTTCGDARSPHRCLPSPTRSTTHTLRKASSWTGSPAASPSSVRGTRGAPSRAGSSSWAPSSPSPPPAAGRSPTTSPHPAARATAPRGCSSRTSPRPPRERRSSCCEAQDGTTLADERDRVDAVLSDVATFDHVASVADPFREGSISADGRIGYARLTLDDPGAGDRQAGLRRALRLRVARRCRRRTGRVRRRRRLPQRRGHGNGHVGIGLLVALLVLLVVFGTVVSAVIPIGLSIVAVGAGIGGIMLLAGGMEVSVSAIPGRRPRRPRRRCRLCAVRGRPLPREPRRRTGQPLAPSDRRWRRPGAAVVFAGGTVAVATAALAITGVGILTSIGLATSLMVLFSVAAATTLLPALLSLLGDRIDSGRVFRRHRPASGLRRPPGGGSGTGSPRAPGPTCWAPMHRPPRRRRTGPRDADRLPGRRRRPCRDHPPPGLRPARRGLRHRDQRSADARRRPPRARRHPGRHPGLTREVCDGSARHRIR